MSFLLTCFVNFKKGRSRNQQVATPGPEFLTYGNSRDNIDRKNSFFSFYFFFRQIMKKVSISSLTTSLQNLKNVFCVFINIHWPLNSVYARILSACICTDSYVILVNKGLCVAGDMALDVFLHIHVSHMNSGQL